MGCVQTKKSSNINIDEFNNNIETLYEFSHGLEELDDVIEYDGNPIKLNYKIENTGKELNLARDMFLLSFYLCGINLKDLLSVHFDNSNYLSFERSKTSRSKRGDSRLTIPIHAVAAQIIDKYLKKGKIDLGYSFSYQNLQRFINRGTKKMRKSLEINSTVCFYSARKTFAQFASELGIPDGVIDYCLGHSDKSRGVIRYYTKVKQKQAEIAINRVIDYVNNPEKYKDYIEMKADIMMMKG